jgi:hypothetical protein
MANLAVLRSAFLGTSWKCEFAESLTELQPELNPDAADEISDSVYGRLADLTPKEAAKTWLSGKLSGPSAAEASEAPPDPSACEGNGRRP